MHRRQLMRKLKNWRYNYNNIVCLLLSGVHQVTNVFVFQQKKVYLERSVKEAEDNIREMLMARRSQ